MTLYSASLRAQRSSPVERGLFASAFDDRDHLDLDHRLGLGEAADLDCRAGRAGDAEIAHAHVAALREFLVVGDKGIGLYDIGPGRPGRLQAQIEVLEGLFEL